MWPNLNACLTSFIRWVKTAAELALLRKSAAISAEAMARCMRLTRASVSEAVLAATFGACEFLGYKACLRPEHSGDKPQQVTSWRLRRVRVQGAGRPADGLPTGGRQRPGCMHHPLLA